MVNEHNAFDLAKYIQDNGIKPMDRMNSDGVDLSGRPAPKDVRVQLNSGVTVRCDVRYDGLDIDGQRRFLVIAEIDWENYTPAILWVDEYPRDVTLRLRIPGMPDLEAERFAAILELRPRKILEVD